MGDEPGLAREQTALLPAAVEDEVGAAHIVRVIDPWVGQLDVFALAFGQSAVKATGRPPYDPADRLRQYPYGGWQRVRSSRAPERERPWPVFLSFPRMPRQVTDSIGAELAGFH